MAAGKTINKGVTKVADEFGKELVSRLQRALIDKKKLATGSLIGQMTHEVKSNDQGQTIVQIFAEDYFRFVDKGRRPGKQPPLEAIKQWTRVKLISEKAAFPIARKIGKFGIPPANIINPTLDELVVEFEGAYAEEMENILGAVLVNDIFNQTNTKGRIIPKTLR